VPGTHLALEEDLDVHGHVVAVPESLSIFPDCASPVLGEEHTLRSVVSVESRFVVPEPSLETTLPHLVLLVGGFPNHQTMKHTALGQPSVHVEVSLQQYPSSTL